MHHQGEGAAGARVRLLGAASITNASFMNEFAFLFGRRAEEVVVCLILGLSPPFSVGQGGRTGASCGVGSGRGQPGRRLEGPDDGLPDHRSAPIFAASLLLRVAFLVLEALLLPLADALPHPALHLGGGRRRKMRCHRDHLAEFRQRVVAVARLRAAPFGGDGELAVAVDAVCLVLQQLLLLRRPTAVRA